MHGIEAIPARSLSFSAPSSQADKNYDLMMLLRQRLVAAGFFEARTSALVSREAAKEEGALTLRNPMGEQQSFLRTSLLPGLKKVLQHNLQQGAPTVRLFELGKIYHRAASAGLEPILKVAEASEFSEEERYSLSLITTGPAFPISWRNNRERELDFYDLKGAIDQLVPGRISYRSCEEPLSEGVGLMLSILCHHHPVGYLALLHPAAARELMLTGREHPIAVAEIDFSKLSQVMGEDRWKASSLSDRRPGQENQSIAPFPAVLRDVALTVAKEIPYADLERVLFSSHEELLESVTLFDLFVDPSGEKIPSDKKSMGLSLKFQSYHRTLMAQEVQESCDRLVMQLKNALGVEVRA
jgi:phenylalanyl-tRNA synthetase beta chain